MKAGGYVDPDLGPDPIEFTRRGLRRRQVTRRGTGTCSECRAKWEGPAAARDAAQHVRERGHVVYVDHVVELTMKPENDGTG